MILFLTVSLYGLYRQNAEGQPAWPHVTTFTTTQMFQCQQISYMIHSSRLLSWVAGLLIPDVLKVFTNFTHKGWGAPEDWRCYVPSRPWEPVLSYSAQQPKWPYLLTSALQKPQIFQSLCTFYTDVWQGLRDTVMSSGFDSSNWDCKMYFVSYCNHKCILCHTATTNVLCHTATINVFCVILKPQMYFVSYCNHKCAHNNHAQENAKWHNAEFQNSNIHSLTHCS